ncbi:MAG TPA: hypothetical protein C5S37_15115 [Methanophagales archaeon]|nr:hypothetical protein [Methanophagales archaeon]
MKNIRSGEFQRAALGIAEKDLRTEFRRSYEILSILSAIAPDELLGMEKVVVSCGDDALQRVKQSHTGSVEHIEDVAIVHYMNMEEGKFLTLWTTLYPNETIANDETEKMVVGMQKWGGSWASDLKELPIAEKLVYQTSSDGVTYQYFWADREWSFYIIPHDFTEDEIAEIVGAVSGEDR